MSKGYADEIFNAGLISDMDYAVAQSYVANITGFLDAGDYKNAYLTWDAFLNGDSTPGGAWFTNVTGGVNYYNIANELPASFDYYGPYVTSDLVRAAIGVGTTPFGNGDVEGALILDVMYSQKERVEALLQHGYAVLIFNGALDLICGAPLVWDGQAQWPAAKRNLWFDADFPAGTVVAGYVRRVQNLVQVVLRGVCPFSSSIFFVCIDVACFVHVLLRLFFILSVMSLSQAGHIAPADQPSRALDLITRLVNGSWFR